VFAIPPSESQKLNPSSSLRNSIGGGKLLDNMTEKQFMNLMILAEEADYNKFLKYFETINRNFVKKYKKQSKSKKHARAMADPVRAERIRERNKEASKRYRQNNREEINARRRTPEYREKRRKQK